MQNQVGGCAKIINSKMAEHEKVVPTFDNETESVAKQLPDNNTLNSSEESPNDANNNSSEDCDQSGSPSNVVVPENPTIKSLSKGSKIRSKSDSTTSSEPDDSWHLIEPDEEMFSISELEPNRSKSTTNDIGLRKMVLNNNNNDSHHDNDHVATNCDNQEQQRQFQAENNKKTFIEIDPLKNERQEYSPTLIKICISLYALIPIASLLALNLLIFLLFTQYWPITLAYFTYLFLDRKTCNRGGRRIDFVYNSKFWNYVAAYFPIKLRHSLEFKLDPSENYLLNFHPHGISAYGCVAAFATNGLNFKQLFPGLTSRFMVHETLYSVPVMRDIFSARGDCSVNSKSLDFILSKGWRENKRGNLLALVGGGLAEADLSDAQVLKIVVRTRKGFVKKALIHGANLIPCIAFGENSIFKKVNFAPNSFMHRFETQFYNLFKFKHPIYYGTSIFNSKIAGSLPYKRPITVVMGDPIEVRRCENPSQDQIDKLHAHYVEQVEYLYKANSDLCQEFDKELVLV